jgi:uncharacterized protein (DUF1697 family)
VTAYAALLRGVNVGGAKVAMSDLRRVAEGLGYGDVATYINSGNLLFASTRQPATLRGELQRGIRDELGLSVDVMVRSLPRLQQVLAANPYPDGDPGRVAIAFLSQEAPAGADAALAAVAVDEPFTIAGDHIYVHFTHGLGRSKLGQRLSALVGCSATVRNLRTVTRLVDLLDR